MFMTFKEIQALLCAIWKILTKSVHSYNHFFEQECLHKLTLEICCIQAFLYVYTYTYKFICKCIWICYITFALYALNCQLVHGLAALASSERELSTCTSLFISHTISNYIRTPWHPEGAKICKANRYAATKLHTHTNTLKYQMPIQTNVHASAPEREAKTGSEAGRLTKWKHAWQRTKSRTNTLKRNI